MNFSELANRIKSTSHCRFTLRPIELNKNRIQNYSELEAIINKSIVRYRGWDFPHINQEIFLRENENIGSYDNWKRQELWKFYQSGQFIYLFQFHEDFFNKEIKSNAYGWIKKYDQNFIEKGFFDFECFINMITEIVEFSNRIFRNNQFLIPLEISISLNNINDRIFTSIDPFRSNRYFKIQTENLTFTKIFNLEDFSELNQNTINCIKYFFERFGLDNINDSSLKDEIDKIKSRSF